MKKRSHAINTIWTVVLTVLSVAWVYPVVMVLINSFKKDSAISTNTAFQLPTAEGFAGLDNYANAIGSKGFLAAFFNSFIISVTSVVLILICCSMCAWFITRVKTWATKLCYFLFVFSMVVPFQMLMFTLANLADKTKLNTPFNICIIYLGFGAGLAVFMFTGFVKSIPLEIEEAAMIDGATQLEQVTKIVLPLAKPTIAVTAMMVLVYVWNEYIFAINFMTGSDTYTLAAGLYSLQATEMSGSWPIFSAASLIVSLPILIVFFALQKNMTEGLTSGGVKG